MPLTYHFKPFPKPGEPYFTIDKQSTRSETTTTPSCACQKEQFRCKQCRQDEREKKTVRRSQSQAMLSPIDEHTDPMRRQLTPKAIRDQRRAMSRVSISSAFESAVGSEEYFPLFHSSAFARSDSSSSGSSSRSRSRRRLGSSSGTQSPQSRRSSDQEQGCSPPVSELAQTPVQEEDSEEKDHARRGS